MTKQKISWEQIENLIPKTTSLYYVDYRESLDESLDALQECIHNGNMEKLYEKVDDWYVDGASYAMDELDKELIQDICNEFEVDEDEAQEIYDEFEDHIRDTYYDRDDSDIIKDLFRNTNNKTMFYDTGYEVAPDSWQWTEKEIIAEGRQIKKALGLKMSDKTWDNELHMMIRQASYGGQLVVYFYDDVEDYINIPQDRNVIRFTDASIAIIDTCGGSGDHCELGGSVINLPLNKENIFICETIKYSYTHNVCGMYSNWCKSTGISFIHKPTKKKAERSSINNHLDIEAIRNATYKAGSCTAGDMDINRHRNATYTNEYPCGNRCSDCGTFWID